MSKKIKKRLKNVVSAGLAYYKQTIANELETHDKHMDKDDYIEFMHMYIGTLTAELELSKLALEMEEMTR
jgi:hypothetical protein